MDLGLAGRVYIVTGGSSGLGAATAAALVGDGSRVVLSARRGDVLAEAVERLGDAAVGVPGDLADDALPGRLVGTAQTTFGRLDGALISVGGPPAGGVLEIGDDQWRAAFETVFLGPVRLARTLAGVLEPGGALTLVLSTSVRAPLADLAISNGLRPGLAMLVKTLADEVGPRGIRVTGVLPGRMDTERVRWLDSREDDPAAARRAHEATIPLRRYGRPEELGAVAAFLLSPAASYVSGTCVAVDGGSLRAS